MQKKLGGSKEDKDIYKIEQKQNIYKNDCYRYMTFMIDNTKIDYILYA